MNKQPSQHPLDSHKKEFEERGVIVLEHVTSMPVFNKPIVHADLVISLNISGCVEAEYDTNPVSFRNHDISVVLPNHTINGHSVTDDYECMMIVISRENFEKMKQDQLLGYQDSLHYHWHAHFHLEDDQFEHVHALFRLFRDINLSESKNRHMILVDLLEVLFMMLQDYRVANGIASRELSPRELLFTRFYDAITNHYTRSREVRFYAGLFCMSPKYFASIIKQETGINACDWITNYVIIQAKSLLRYHSDLSIQQIAQRLGFSEQSSFCRYFKTHTGMSPKSFR